MNMMMLICPEVEDDLLQIGEGSIEENSVSKNDSDNEEGKDFYSNGNLTGIKAQSSE